MASKNTPRQGDTPEVVADETVDAGQAPAVEETASAVETVEAAVEVAPKTVTLQLGDTIVETAKPSAEYTQYVRGYGYKELG